MTVTPSDTAIADGVGDVAVLSTPRVVALCERASVLTTIDLLGAEETSVGTSVQISHVSPTGVGEVVVAEATLDRVEGRRLHFTVSVSDGHGLIAAGKLTRAIVNRDQFLAKTNGPS